MAMAGKNCVAIGSDLRLGVQFQTLACDYKKVYPIHDHLYLGLAGLGTDSQTLYAPVLPLCMHHVLTRLMLFMNVRACIHAAETICACSCRPSGDSTACFLVSCLIAHCRFQKFKFHHNIYRLKEERDIKPATFAQFVSSTLYSKR